MAAALSVSSLVLPKIKMSSTHQVWGIPRSLSDFLMGWASRWAQNGLIDQPNGMASSCHPRPPYHTLIHRLVLGCKAK